MEEIKINLSKAQTENLQALSKKWKVNLEKTVKRILNNFIKNENL